jgi:hypothetical protein
MKGSCIRFIRIKPIRISELIVSTALDGAIFPSAPTARARMSGCSRFATLHLHNQIQQLEAPICMSQRIGAVLVLALRTRHPTYSTRIAKHFCPAKFHYSSGVY